MDSHSEIITQDVEYTSGGNTMQGYIAYDNSIQGKMPGILIVHQWKGLTDYEKMRARQLAELGYVAFAVDVYGKGIRPSTPEEAAKEAGKFYGNVELLRERVISGLQELLKQSQVDPAKTAAIGYCFGGSAVIELARSGAEIDGAVSFHGGLKPAGVEAAKNIKASLLVLHGADDPFIKSEDKLAFQKEMAEAKTDMVFVEYSGAVHSFTDKGAGNDNSRGAAYNETADKRSWQAMKDFFQEIFSK
jgi:dienelactone hydrolase